MVHPSISPTSEGLILDLLGLRKSLTLEQVVTLLPELSWNQVFKTVDELSRRGEIILLRRGFEYEIEDQTFAAGGNGWMQHGAPPCWESFTHPCRRLGQLRSRRSHADTNMR